MVKVLDACALMVYLEKGHGYEKIKKLFVEAVNSERNLLMTTVNFGEVFYVLARSYGIAEAEKICQAIDTFPIELVPVDASIAKQAALYKVSHKIAYADCFAAALTKLRKGEIITLDREFKALEREVKVTWI